MIKKADNIEPIQGGPASRLSPFLLENKKNKRVHLLIFSLI